MSKKGSQTATSTTTTAPTPEAKALYDKILQQAQGVAATPYTAYGGELVAGLTPQQQLGIASINAQAGSAQPSVQQALQMAQQAAQPLTAEQIQQYVNPYTQNVVAATQAQFANQNAQQRQGVLGNAIAQGALGGNREAVAQAELANQQQLAQAPVIANLMSQGYGQGVSTALAEQQARMAGAQQLGNLGIAGQQAGLAGAGAQLGAGTLGQQTQQAADLAAYQQFQNQQAYPFQTLQWLAGLGTGVGSQLGGTTTGTQTQPQPGLFQELLGGAGAIGGLLGSGGLFGSKGIFSDKKVKENIKRIGKTNDGQNIYLYNYKDDPTPRVGLMAQEVEKVHPEAVSEINGVKAVDYGEALKHAVRRARGGAIDRADGGQIWGPVPQSMVAGEPWERAVGIAPKIGITHGRGAPAPMSMRAPAQSGSQDFSKIAKQLGSLAGSVYDKIKSNPASKFADTPDTAGVAPAVAAPTSLAPPPQGVAPVVTDRLPPTGQFASLEPGLGSANAIFYRGGGVHGYALGGSPEDPDTNTDNASLVSEMPQGVAPTAEKELSVASAEPEAKEMAQPELEPQGVAPSPSLKDVSRAGYAGIDTGPVSIGDLKTGEEPEEAAAPPSGVAPKPITAVPKGAVPPGGGVPPQDLAARVQSFDIKRAYDRRIPASIRTNNPGAMWSGPSSRKFGAVAHDTIGGGNDIAIFPAFEMGAAAHMDLLANKYSGMPLNAAIRKWSGGNYSAEYAQEISKATGIPLNARLTPDLLNSPAIIPFAKAMAQHEAGRGSTATPEQWQTAYKMFRAGTPNVEGFDVASANQPSAGVAPRGREGVRVASADTGVASDALPPEAEPLTRGRSQGVAGPEPGMGAGEERPGFLSNIDLSAQSKLWPALTAAGFSMMASRAPTLGQAIGEGGLAGIQTYAAEKEAQQAQAQAQQKMALEQRKEEREELKPISVPWGGTMIDPITHQPVFTGAGAETRGLPKGFRRTDTGDLEPIPGGPADPATIERNLKIKQSAATQAAAGAILQPDTVSAMATQYLAGDHSVKNNLGRGVQGANNLVALNNEIYKQARAAGLSPSEIALKMAEFGGTQQAMKTLATQEAKMGSAAREAEGAIKLARGAIEKVPRTSFLPLNKLIQGYQANTLNPDQAELYTRVQGIVNTYSAVMARGSNVTTDSSRDHANALLNTAGDPATFNRVLDTMLSEIDMAKKSPEGMRDFYRNQYGAKSITSEPAATTGTPTTGATKSPAAAPTAPVLPPPEQRKVGTTYQAPSGHLVTWDGKGAVPVVTAPKIPTQEGAAPPTTAQNIPRAAIEALRSNPERASEFDKKFGSGVAASILKGGA